MYLKRVELCGFKSFADRTRLDFEPGITAIVGPNGCGKSNVSDSIRWCLGEQSARSMRSHQMLDVIFGGSHSRQTTGMAEVSLTFDNSKNLLPIDFSEVTVTRRLFRSGESEFYINKAQCRLKDIRDLFLDTGIGSEGYAIIEQGKVEFILSAKPEQKREMFEEAAGVSKYKARREETLRKLEKVDIDLNRIADMLTLLKEQITALDIAARKARQYQKYQENLKKMEVASIVSAVTKAQEDIDRIKKELDPKEKEFESQNTALDMLEAEISGLRVQQLEKDELYIKQQDELSQIKSGINLSDERISQASQRETELKERQKALTLELSGGKNRIQELTSLSANVMSLKDSISVEVKKLEAEYLEKEASLLGLKNKIEETQKTASGSKARLFDITQERMNRHNEINAQLSKQAHCQAQAQSLNKELARLTEQYLPMKEERSSKDNQLNSLSAQINDFAGSKGTLDAEFAGIELRKTESEGRSIALKEKIASLQSKHQTLIEWEEKDPVRHAVRAVSSLGLAGIKGPISALIRIDPGMEETVAAALGEKLNYIVADTMDTAQTAINHLKDNNLGRAVFIILDRLDDVRAFSPIAMPHDARELSSMVTSDADVAKAVKFVCSEIIVSENAFYGFCVVQGGSRISLDKPVLIEEYLRTIDLDLGSARTELEATIGSVNALAADLSRKAEDIKLAENSRQQKIVESDWLRKNVESLGEEMTFLEKEIGLNKNDIETHTAEENAIKGQLSSLYQGIENLKKEETDTELALKNAEDAVSGYRALEAEQSPLLTEAKVSWATQANELAGREREEQKLAEDLSALSASIEQSDNELSSIKTKLDDQHEIQKTETLNLKNFQAELTVKEKEVQGAINERQALIMDLDIKNSRLHELRQTVETLKTDMHNLQIEQRSFELQRQGMEQRLKDTYTLEYENIKAEYAAETFSEDEISRLKRRIESLGAVNLAAPEEYTSLEERYNFLLAQQQDLLKAKEDLHQVITKINQNTRENFKKSFDQIREYFKSIYQQLFEGGEADLVLTDEENLLETGVEILAQPPGKKLQNIALLSGGEKALTAIALLFAFFMVKSSPFCILDEVDAPLDDANIGRFINMIKEFSTRSQFLVITHNKRSMEMADILYGVTMEELGVSKIISVKLKKDNLVASA